MSMFVWVSFAEVCRGVFALARGMLERLTNCFYFYLCSDLLTKLVNLASDPARQCNASSGNRMINARLFHVTEMVKEAKEDLQSMDLVTRLTNLTSSVDSLSYDMQNISVSLDQSSNKHSCIHLDTLVSTLNTQIHTLEQHLVEKCLTVSTCMRLCQVSSHAPNHNDLLTADEPRYSNRTVQQDQCTELDCFGLLFPVFELVFMLLLMHWLVIGCLVARLTKPAAGSYDLPSDVILMGERSVDAQKLPKMNVRNAGAAGLFV